MDSDPTQPASGKPLEETTVAELIKLMDPADLFMTFRRDDPQTAVIAARGAPLKIIKGALGFPDVAPKPGEVAPGKAGIWADADDVPDQETAEAIQEEFAQKLLQMIFGLGSVMDDDDKPEPIIFPSGGAVYLAETGDSKRTQIEAENDVLFEQTVEEVYSHLEPNAIGAFVRERDDGYLMIHARGTAADMVMHLMNSHGLLLPEGQAARPNVPGKGTA